MKQILIILVVFFASACFNSLCVAGDYFQYSTTNGRITNHTYVDNQSGATHGGSTTSYGNTHYHNTPNYSGSSITNGNITLHTYTDKRTGAVTGGSSWRYGNTTYYFGNPPPHPYK
jgi:hypothetical protein